ncbi:TetR/AcrR family transcriptional regulator [Nocardia sp. NPDC050630]|uniref:TetR/AcrR family transcriptional regulator n=1 Tax=Nocardia sp. NPDC050630 TaxID=3364321 RepID=UPI003795A4EA
MDVHSARVRHDFRRRSALAAASEVFVAYGYRAATMDKIAHRAGCSKPILYQYFPTKLDLYLLVLQDQLDSLTESMWQALRATDDNRGRVYAAIAAYFDFIDRDTPYFRLVFDSYGAGEPSVQWRIGRATDACIDAIAHLVARDSGLDVQRARLFAVGLIGASQFAAQYWLETGRTAPKAEAIEAVVALCWSGLSRVLIGDGSPAVVA